MVYLKPDIILVRDRFDTTNVAQVRSLIHSRNRPEFAGIADVVRGSPAAGILELRDNAFRLENGASEASVDVLWPSDPILRFVGGAGYEGYADGYNSDPYTDCQDWLKNHWELQERAKLIEGQWRTEITATPTEADGNLIHAIFVSESSPATRPAYTVVREGSSMVVSVDHDGLTTEVSFPDHGVPTLGGATAPIEIFSDDVESGGLANWSFVVN
jgi:hypothetical protein